MNPVKASLRYPQVTLIVTLMLFGLGLYSLATMPRREDPKITIRTGIVAAIYPGATAEELEKQVTQKIEERLFRFAEVRKEKTFSTSRDGIVVINVELETVREEHGHLLVQAAARNGGVEEDGPAGGRAGPDCRLRLRRHGGGAAGYPWRPLRVPRAERVCAERIEAQLRTIRAVSKVQRIGEQKEEIEISSSLEQAVAVLPSLR